MIQILRSTLSSYLLSSKMLQVALFALKTTSKKFPGVYQRCSINFLNFSSIGAKFVRVKTKNNHFNLCYRASKYTETLLFSVILINVFLSLCDCFLRVREREFFFHFLSNRQKHFREAKDWFAGFVNNIS